MKNPDPLESVIQSKTLTYARERGALAYKVVTPSYNGFPDTLFFTPQGVPFLIEVKRLGKKPTAPQLREHARLKGHCVLVFTIDTVEQGRFVVDLMMGAQT